MDELQRPYARSQSVRRRNSQRCGTETSSRTMIARDVELSASTAPYIILLENSEYDRAPFSSIAQGPQTTRTTQCAFGKYWE